MKESFRNSFYENFTVDESDNNVPPNSRIQSAESKDVAAYKKIRGSNFETHMNLEDYAPVHFPDQEMALGNKQPEESRTHISYESNAELQANAHTEYPKYS